MSLIRKRASMPILWRYLVKNFFRVFFLSLISFVFILFVMRAQEIARFATLSPNTKDVILFALFQIPYILPFAVCISALIASVISAQGLCQSHEATALRCAGLSFFQIQIPLIFVSLFLCLGNFFIASELSPRCRLFSTNLLYHAASSNPLVLFKKSKFLKVKNSFIDMELSDDDDSAKNLFFAFQDSSTNLLSLIVAKSLVVEKNMLKGHNLTFFSALDKQEQFDDILIENQSIMSMEAGQISALLQRAKQTARFDQLPTKPLLIKYSLDSGDVKSGKAFLFEVNKRAFFTLCPFTFVVIGLAYGVYIGRTQKKSRLFKAACLILLVFMSYLLVKAVHRYTGLLFAFLIFPHLLSYLFCGLRLRSLQRGIEK